VVAEEVTGIVVDLQEDLDCAVDGFEDDPLGFVAGRLAAFEDPAA
jgi:hypothetical protein